MIYVLREETALTWLSSIRAPEDSLNATVWMVVTQNSYVEILMANVTELGGGGLWKVIRSWGQSPPEDINTLMKEVRGAPLCLPPREDTVNEVCNLERALTWPCPHPDLWLPASKTVRNIFLLFEVHPGYGIF